MIKLIISFSSKSQTPCSSFRNPSFWKPVMFNALHVVNNNKWNIFSYPLYFYINMAQDYTIYFLAWLYYLKMCNVMDYATNYNFCYVIWNQ